MQRSSTNLCLWFHGWKFTLYYYWFNEVLTGDLTTLGFNCKSSGPLVLDRIDLISVGWEASNQSRLEPSIGVVFRIFEPYLLLFFSYLIFWDRFDCFRGPNLASDIQLIRRLSVRIVVSNSIVIELFRLSNLKKRWSSYQLKE